jgi:hypothetical protein
MEMSYLWRRISWLEQSKAWMHQRADICNFWSRRLTQKLQKILKSDIGGVGSQRKSAFKFTRVERIKVR